MSYENYLQYLSIRTKFSIMLPMLATSDKSVENLILNTVKDNPNTSAKKIYNSITKAGITVTYHKIFEKMQDMVKKGVMIKNDRLYSVSNVWVERTTKFMETIHTKQMMITEKGLCFGADDIRKVELMVFNSFNNYANYIWSLRDRLMIEDKNEDKTICWICNHSVISLLNMQQRILTINKIKDKSIKYYSLVRGSDKLDNVMLDFNKKFGINTMAVGFKDGSKTDIAIYGNILLYAIYPVGFVEAVDKFYKDNNDMSDINKLVSEFDKISKIYLVVIREPYLVETYKKFIKSKFD